MQLIEVPMEQIDFGERRRQDYGDLTQLASTIERHGLIQPIAVKQQADGRFLLLAGGRRFMACKEIPSMTQIPCRVYEEDSIDEYERRMIELLENSERKDPTYAEEVSLKKEVHELHVKKFGQATTKKKTGIDEEDGWDYEKTAALFGEKRSNLWSDVKLAEAIEHIPDLAKCKTKTEANRLLTKMKEEAAQEELLRRRKLAMAQKAHSSEMADKNTQILHKKLSDRFILSDFFDGVAQVANESIDLIEVDPPYGIDLKEGKRANIRRAGGGRQLSNVYSDTEDYIEVPDREYDSFLDLIMAECRRCLKPNGWLIFWFASRRYTLVRETLEKHRFEFEKCPAVWVKENAPGYTGDQDRILGSTYEPFFYAHKGDAMMVKRGRANVFSFKPVNPHKKRHPAERPIPMMVEVLQTFTDPASTIMVPFLGSGNTILAAHFAGMDAFGWELGKSYKQTFETRLDELLLNKEEETEDEYVGSA